MGDALTWGVLIAAGGSIIAIVTFWMNRGKAEAEAGARADAAMHVAKEAKAMAEAGATRAAEVELRMAREYATSAALAAVETRFLASIDGLRVEVRGMNSRLDRFLDRVTGHVERDQA